METKMIKILLVDDDEMMRIYFRDIFWIHGRSSTYDVVMACSIAEAEKIVFDPQTKPDTIFLDVMMPIAGQSNSVDAQVDRTIHFVEKIKQNKDISPTKIIIYSGQREKAIEEALVKAGADGYLIKGELMPKEIIDFTDKIHGSDN